MRRVVVLGAHSHIASYLIPKLLHQPVDLTLFARHAKQRLNQYQEYQQVKIVAGDWNNLAGLHQAISNFALVVMTTGQFIQANRNVIQVMKEQGARRLIVAGILGLEDEIPGYFGEWNAKMLGINTNLKLAKQVIEQSNLDYTYMRMAWLYDQPGNERYELISQGKPFADTQLTRQAAAQFIADVVSNPSLAIRQSVGVAEPNTQWHKPSFY